MSSHVSLIPQHVTQRPKTTSNVQLNVSFWGLYSSEHKETAPPLWGSTPQFPTVYHHQQTWASISLHIIHPSVTPIPSSLTLHPSSLHPLTLMPSSHSLHLHPFIPQSSLQTLSPSGLHHLGSTPSISCNKLCWSISLLVWSLLGELIYFFKYLAHILHI